MQLEAALRETKASSVRWSAAREAKVFVEIESVRSGQLSSARRGFVIVGAACVGAVLLLSANLGARGARESGSHAAFEPGSMAYEPVFVAVGDGDGGRVTD